MIESRKIITTPAEDALFAFDAKNGVDPARTIAERIADRYGFGWKHQIVDEISAAIEDARDIGKMRATLEMVALK